MFSTVKCNVIVFFLPIKFVFVKFLKQNMEFLEGKSDISVSIYGICDLLFIEIKLHKRCFFLRLGVDYKHIYFINIHFKLSEFHGKFNMEVFV